MKLRDYQMEAVKSIEHDWDTYQSVLLVSAVGSGKTQIFCELIDRNCQDKRALVLVHRRELVQQAHDRLLRYWPHWTGRTGIVMADKNESDKQILFGTVQTIMNREVGKIDYLIIDECHHSASATYLEIINVMKAANPNIRILGVTATPIRADGKAMRHVFEHVSAVYDIKYMVTNKYLVPPRWLAVQTGISLADVAVNYNDGEKEFSSKALADVYETDNCFDIVVETHKQYASNRKAIAFVASVEGAYRLAEKFNEAGIAAAAADGTTKTNTRKEILNNFSCGALQVIICCQLWTEGMDLPEISCVHQVRPTQSDGLYIQMIGRGLRLFPGKTDCLILDYAPEDTRQIIMLGDILGAVRKDGYIKKVEPGQVAGGFIFTGDIEYLEGDITEIITKQLDYLDMTPFSWYRDDKGWMSLGLGMSSDGKERTILISPPDENNLFRLYAVEKGRGKAILRLTGEWDDVKEQADSWSEKYSEPILSMKQKRWRKQRASEKQQELLSKWGRWQPGMNKGEAAAIITHRFAKFSLPKGD